jgi:hypothetical protein
MVNSQVSYLLEVIRHTSFSSNKEIIHLRNNEKNFVLKASFFASRSDVIRSVKEDTAVLGTLNVLCKTKKSCFNLRTFVQNHIFYSLYGREEIRTKKNVQKENSATCLKICLANMLLGI